MFRAGLAHVEDNRIKVPVPKWDVKGIGVKKQPAHDGAQIVYRGGVNLVIQAPEPGIAVYLTNTGADPRDGQAQRLRMEDSDQLNIKRSPNIKLVSQAGDGTYGQVITLSFVNEDGKYEVQPVTQQKLLEEEFKFVFPQDREALAVTIGSLLESAIERGLVDRAGARALLEELVGELEES